MNMIFFNFLDDFTMFSEYSASNMFSFVLLTVGIGLKLIVDTTSNERERIFQGIPFDILFLSGILCLNNICVNEFSLLRYCSDGNETVFIFYAFMTLLSMLVASFFVLKLSYRISSIQKAQKLASKKNLKALASILRSSLEIVVGKIVVWILVILFFAISMVLSIQNPGDFKKLTCNHIEEITQ